MSLLRLFLLGLVPLLVMLVPVTLLLGQVSLWYQQRPLRLGEEAVVTLKLNGGADDPFPDVSLQGTGPAETALGPVRVDPGGSFYPRGSGQAKPEASAEKGKEDRIHRRGRGGRREKNGEGRS